MFKHKDTMFFIVDQKIKPFVEKQALFLSSQVSELCCFLNFGLSVANPLCALILGLLTRQTAILCLQVSRWPPQRGATEVKLHVWRRDGILASCACQCHHVNGSSPWQWPFVHSSSSSGFQAASSFTCQDWPHYSPCEMPYQLAEAPSSEICAPASWDPSPEAPVNYQMASLPQGCSPQCLSTPPFIP